MGEVDSRMAELGLVREPVGGLPDDVRWERRTGDAFGSASIGAIAVADTPRDGAREAVRALLDGGIDPFIEGVLLAKKHK